MRINGDPVIAKSTVLILGAGSSTHVGYPLGPELVASLCRIMAREQPVDLPDGFTQQQVQEFLLRLCRSGHYSIDAFLETVPKYADLGKYLIAQQLKHLEQIDRLFSPNRSGWYQYLLNQLLVHGKPNLDQNRLGIVTFNYDRSLEAYLHTALKYRFDLTETAAAELLAAIPIVHVHGVLGAYPETAYSPDASPEELLAISAQIQIIHELRDDSHGFCNEAFARAHRMLQDAERIFFLGFGFHTDNVRRFQFFSPKTVAERMVRATTIGMQSLDYKKRPADLAEYGLSEDVFPQNGANCELFFGRTAYLE